MGHLYTPRYCYISPLCFTARRRLEVHDLTQPLLRTNRPHAGQAGHRVGRQARAASTSWTIWITNTRANCHAATSSSVSVTASSTALTRHGTDGSSWRMLSVRHSIGKTPLLDHGDDGSKRVSYYRCYARPPLTGIYARHRQSRPPPSDVLLQGQ